MAWLNRFLASVTWMVLTAGYCAGQFPEPQGPFPPGPWPGGWPGGEGMRPGPWPGGEGMRPGPWPGGEGMRPGPWPGPDGMRPDWGRSDGMRRSGGDGRSDSSRRGSPDSGADRSQRIEAFIRQFDANGDGMISSNEVSESRRGLYEGLVRRSGLNPATPVPVQALRDAMLRGSSRSGGPPGASSGGPLGKDAESAKTSGSLVPGFGPPAQATFVMGFGAPPAAKSSSTTSGSTPTSSPASTATSSASSPSTGSSNSASPSSGSSQTDERFRKFAESLLRQYDRNKNGVLEKDEWSQMKGSWRDSDSNGDGTITLDELTAKVASYSQSRQTPSSSPSSGLAGSGSTASGGAGSNAAPKKSYRFLSPQERLPRGLPDWFMRKDANGDGQVAMVEYASGGWTESLAGDFVKYDLNNDGMITPDECLKAMRPK